MQADARGREYVHERTLLVFLKAAARLGIDIDAAAKAPTRYRVGADTLVPTAEYQAVLHAIFADPRETLGIELARAMPTELSGLWGFLLRSSPTYGDMLRRAERYIRLFFRFTRLTLSEDGSDVVLVCDHPDPSPFGRREQEVCFFLGQWLTWGRDIVGHAVKAEQARMRWRGPAAKEQLQSLFGCPIAFGAADDALIFRRDVLDLPLPEQTPELDGMFDVYAAAAIRRMTPQATFVDRVREALSEGLLTEATNESAVAKQLGITVRTLHRRLAESQSSFREIRRELLRARAEELLREPRLPIAEVSYLLGYAETSNFHRAFRRWTGVTPAIWRSRALQASSGANG